MDEEKSPEQHQYTTKNIAKVIGKTVFGPFIIVGIIMICVLFIFFFFGGETKLRKKNAGKEVPLTENSKNAPATSRDFINSVDISEDGQIEYKKSFEAIWREYKNQNNELARYLYSPTELATLVRAAAATQYPDTRKDVTKEVNWKEINSDIKSKKVQGIIKFQKEDNEGNKEFITYVSPKEYEQLKKKYNDAETEKEIESARKELEKHFTLEKRDPKSLGSSSGLGVITGNGEFKTYGLTDNQISQIADLCVAEQGNGIANVAAEASLIANLAEINYGGTEDIMGTVVGGPWFASQSKAAMGTGIASADEVEAVKRVLVQGYRTLPGYVNEHDCILDIASISTGNKAEHSNYIPHETVIYQSQSVGGGQWTFYSFPASGSDAFGYTPEAGELRQKIGDAYYDPETWQLVNGNGKKSTSSKSSPTPTKTSSKSTSSDSETSTTTGDAIIEEAEKYVGILDYVWGGDSLETGADCSGFVTAILWKLNLYSGERMTTGGLATYGEEVNGIENAQAGDIIVYAGDGGTADEENAHTGFYDGNGGLIHAPYTGQKVAHIQDINFKPIATIRRATGVATISGKNSTSTSSSTIDNSLTSNLYIAKIAKFTNITSNDENGTKKSVSNVGDTEIDYRKYISKYDMPFNYLFAMLIMGNEYDFVADLAQLVYDSEFIINIKVNDTITTTETPKESNTEGKLQFEYIKVGTNNKPVTIETMLLKLQEINSEWDISTFGSSTEKYDDNAIFTGKDLLENSTKMYKTNEADEDKKVYCLVESKPLVDLESQYDLYVATPKEKNEDEKEDTTQNMITTNSTSTTFDIKLSLADAWCVKYSEEESEVQEKTDIQSEEPNFVTLFLKHHDARTSILSAVDWLWEILESNNDTKDLIDLTKYFLYIASGGKTSYGVTSYDFSEFDPANFMKTKGSSGYFAGSNFEEKVWFALTDLYSEYATAGAMGNFAEESGFMANNLQNDYETSLGYTDKSYTDAVNNGNYTRQQFSEDSAGYGLAQWTSSGRKEGLYDLAKKEGTGIDNEDTQIKWLLKEIEVYCKKWQDSKTIKEAAVNFHNEFEISNDTADQIQERVNSAEEIYKKYHGKPKPTISVGNFPRYYQTDEKWASLPYGSSTIGEGGCGACALAMAVSGLTGKTVEPPEIVSYLNSIGKNTINEGEGTDSATAVAEKYGLSIQVVHKSNQSAIDEALDQGKVCMFSVSSNGIYTGAGHYILCYKRDGQGYYIVESGHYYDSDKPYSYDYAMGSSNNSGMVNILGK